MEKVLFKDVTPNGRESIVSFDRLSCVGDAVLSENGTVRVKNSGGVRTGCFKTGSSEVTVYLSCKSEKPIVMKIGYVTRNGDISFEGIHPANGVPKNGEITIWKPFDAGNLVVYYDAVSLFVQIECEEETEFRIVDGKAWIPDELECLKSYGENLEVVLKNIESRFAELEYRCANNTENLVVTPNGERYVINIDNDKNMYLTSTVPSKVLFVGNSLLLGLCMKYGMCATSPNADFYHYVCEAIKKKNPNATFTKAHAARYEHLDNADNFETLWNELPNPYTQRPLKESFTSDLDLIILQLGENINNPHKSAAFEKTVDKFILSIKELSPKARIVWVHGWGIGRYSERIIIDACRRHRIGDICLRDLFFDKESRPKFNQEYETADGGKDTVDELWLEHPGDIGMKKIADRIIDFLKM